MTPEVAAARARAAEFLAGLDDSKPSRAIAAREGRGEPGALVNDLVGDVADARAEHLAGALVWLDDLRSLDGTVAGQVALRAGALQHEDGHWDTADAKARVAVTGTLAGHLAKSPHTRLEVLDAAGDWLAAQFTPDLLQGFQWDNIAAYAHTFANHPHDAGDEILQWCGRELERGLRARQFSAVRTARVLVWCDAPVLPGARIEPAELIAAMLSEQAEDGGFGGPADDRGLRSFEAWLALGALA